MSKNKAPIFFFFIFTAALVAAVIRPCPASMMSVSEKDEKELGEEAAKEIIAQYGLVDSKAEEDRLIHVGMALVQASGRPELEYHFYIINTDMVNAFALPGGYIFTTRGMMDFVDDDDELAAVIGHEVVHVAKKHGVVQYKQSMRSMMINLFLLILTQNPNAVIANEMYQQGKSEIFGRHAEVEADTVGLEYIIKAGYNPSAMIGLMEKLGRIEQHQAPIFEGYFEVHPPSAERIENIKKHLAELNVTYGNVSSYKVRGRTFAREECAAGGGDCSGVLFSGGRELARFYSADDKMPPYERAREAARTLNRLLDKGVDIYDVRTDASGDYPAVLVKDTLLARALPGDAKAASKAQSDLVEDWSQNIKNFIWTDTINDDFNK